MKSKDIIHLLHIANTYRLSNAFYMCYISLDECENYIIPV